MNRYLKIVLPIAAFSLLPSCDDRNVNAAGKKMASAMSNLMDFAHDKKDDFTKAAQKQLDTLSAKIESASDSAKTELIEKRKQLADALERAKSAGEAGWDKTKSEIVDGLNWLETKLKN